MNSPILLTRRENEIAEYLAWGASYKEIANQLFISTRTVETTARNVKNKVGVNKVTELSSWWFCTHFNISLELSPLKRSLVSCVFLLLFSVFEYSTNHDAIRSMRGRNNETRETREARRVRKESDYLFEI
jgi:DNA-binding CsgD family transcriptional regulator